MRCLERDVHFLHVLKNTKCKTFRKLLIQNCDEKVIQTLAEIVHNILHGNIKIDSINSKKLKKYKNHLRKLHSKILKKKLPKQRRRIFSNQDGGFWTPLIAAALQALADYGIKKLST